MFICASGEPGTGKSVWSSRAVPILCGRLRCGAIIVDPVGSRAYGQFSRVGAIKDALYQALSQRRIVVLRSPSVAMVDSLCWYLISQGERYPRQDQIPNVVLVIDELRWYAKARKTMADNLVNLARGHRNVNCTLVGLTQSHGDLSRDLTCSVTNYRFYKVSAGQDLRRIRQDMNRELADRVKVLWKPPENTGAKEGAVLLYP